MSLLFATVFAAYVASVFQLLEITKIAAWHFGINNGIPYKVNMNTRQLQHGEHLTPFSCAPVVYNFNYESDLAAFTDPEFSNNYCAQNAFIADGSLVLRLTAECGPSIGPVLEFREGRVEARVRTGKTSGVVTSLYLRSGIGTEGDQDEVDVEFVGKDPTHFQSFFWVGGQRGQAEPDYHDVGHDTSKDFHIYGIDYRADAIKWLFDGKVVRVLRRSNTAKFPTKPQRFKATIWDGNSFDDWAGNGSAVEFPQYAYFDWIRFWPYC
ncbi:concanavalin A-like lectin/glucanase domain-containing protein [Thamnocephalis sphaerospora]|uniref:Concanavalin A-like lectin/glucanase domain-containing protein n=1 Tax=Thamnocephalis sphaerospora TaxID=78915 RepID=A0A4P9XLG3_9FUNG|nr:concanavalin A-like lectin/glucanase domain-containing protein [Thamnocephalis sphaerospora]|eukprot:RKP06642.1 concanavalin A-like lectin/glucanase domain-containing protein [Thamnocephalis sphaerospora]